MAARDINQALLLLEDASRLLNDGIAPSEVGRRMPEALQAVRFLQGLAEDGEPTAASALGWARMVGFGVKKDSRRAAEWYALAAKRGDVTGRFYLGSIYQYGLGRTKEPREAAKWMRLAAQGGHVDALYRHGWMLLEGYGLRRDRARGLEVLEQAALRGSVEAAAALASELDKEGPERDAAAAVRWYRRAARGGDAQAMNNLGVCYLRGDGVKRSKSRARAWYEKAARLGNAVARENLLELDALAFRARFSAKLERYCAREQWAAAEKALRGALERFPEDHWLITQLADVLYEQHRYRPALRLYRKASDLVPECALVRWGLAGAWAACGDTREARRIFQSLAREKPEVLAAQPCSEGLRWARGMVADSHYRLGQLAEREGAAAEARRHYRAYLRCMERPAVSIESRKDAWARLRALGASS